MADKPPAHEEVPLGTEHVPSEAPHGEVEQAVPLALKLAGNHGGQGVAGHGRSSSRG
ncbi:hypothetical protein A176_004069 [Myxococcus hansupus]|uniref:Uncharacterized protein n=1 Tax=Pseudomyxococcus hansupus TaxID=1297742 RepID=A0A0H4XG18_9BACT|nr:hypothetical protein A176_004069 [Myxococcus hansupus]